MANTENTQAEENLSQSEQPKSSPKTKLLAAGIVSFIIVVESVVAYLVFPPAQDMVALEADRLGDTVSAEADAKAQAENQGPPLIEITLGKPFTVSAFQPTSNTTLRIDFQLFGLAKQEDENELLALHEKLEHRFREQVIVTIRSAELTDFSEPGLGLIKRKILEKTNRSYGKRLLQEIIIPDFSFVEQ